MLQNHKNKVGIGSRVEKDFQEVLDKLLYSPIVEIAGLVSSWACGHRARGGLFVRIRFHKVFLHLNPGQVDVVNFGHAPVVPALDEKAVLQDVIQLLQHKVWVEQGQTADVGETVEFLARRKLAAYFLQTHN